MTFGVGLECPGSVTVSQTLRDLESPGEEDRCQHPLFSLAPTQAWETAGGTGDEVTTEAEGQSPFMNTPGTRSPQRIFQVTEDFLLVCLFRFRI